MSRPRKAALFVDFDNIYLSLQKASPRAAERFARQPDRWLRWLAAGGHESAAEEGGSAATPRAVLLRRCYLTPGRFGEYRPFFTRAGFVVVDCPPFTRMAKNSADIVMVMDVLDALDHSTRFEEFIVFSGDADFTPVLLRLRMHDRRTAVLTDVLSAAAYRAASDNAIAQDTFIEEALDIEEGGQEFATETSPAYSSSASETVDLAAVAAAVEEQLRQFGRLGSMELVATFKRWPVFTTGPRWFGHGTLRRLCEKLHGLRPAVLLEPGDDVYVTLGEGPVPAGEHFPGLVAGGAETGEALRQRILREVANALSASPGPIDMASLGTHIIRVVGPIAKDSDWAGFRTLGALIRRAVNPNMVVHISAAGVGYVLDPARHSTDAIPAGGAEPAPLDLAADVLQVVDKIAAVTECPRMATSDYRILFEEIAKYDFGSEFNMNRASADIRDICVRGGRAIGRRAVNFVLAGLRYHDFSFAGAERSAADVATAFRDNLIDLCEHASLQLSEEEKAHVSTWLGIGGSGPPVPLPGIPAIDDRPSLEEPTPFPATGEPGDAMSDPEGAPGLDGEEPASGARDSGSGEERLEVH